MWQYVQQYYTDIIYNNILKHIIYTTSLYSPGQRPIQLLKQAGIFCPANQAHTSLPRWRVNPKMSTKNGKPAISNTLAWGCQIVNFLLGFFQIIKNDIPQRFQRCQQVRNLIEASCQSFLQLPISVPQRASSSLPKNGDHWPPELFQATPYHPSRNNTSTSDTSNSGESNWVNWCDFQKFQRHPGHLFDLGTTRDDVRL